MIACTMCGNHNADDSAFCGDCGQFLEWTGEKVAEERTVVVVEEVPIAIVDTAPRPWYRRAADRMRGLAPSYTVEERERPRGYQPRPVMKAAVRPAPVPAGGVAAPNEPPPASTAAAPPPAAARPPAGAPPPPPSQKASSPPPRAAAPPPAPAQTAPAKATPPPPPAVATKPAPPPPPPGGANAAPPPPPGAAKKAAPPPPPPGGAAAKKAAPPPPPGAVKKAAPPPPPGAKKPAPPPPRGGSGGGTRDELAASLVTPVSGRATASLADDLMEMAPQPVHQKVRAIVKTKPSRRLEPGDLVCGLCGEGNPPTRRFCSRCGESLAAAGVVRAVWWRRFFRWLIGPHRKPLAAGTRPGEKGTREHRTWLIKLSLRRLRIVVTVVLVLIGIVYTFYPPFREVVRDNVAAVYHQVRPSLRPVHPVLVRTNVQQPGHPAEYTADEYTDTYWAAPWGSSRNRPQLYFTLGSPALLRSVILRSGATDEFVQHGRPSIIRLTYNTGKTETIVPQDTPDQQVLKLSNAVLVTSVTIEIDDVYDGQEVKDVAISELELFSLR